MEGTEGIGLDILFFILFSQLPQNTLIILLLFKDEFVQVALSLPIENAIKFSLFPSFFLFHAFWDGKGFSFS